MKIQVTIQVSSDVVRILYKRGAPTSDSKELFKILEELNVVLEQMHPDTENSDLGQYFTVEVPDHATAEKVIARLQHCKAIEAAYLKPPDEMP